MSTATPLAEQEHQALVAAYGASQARASAVTARQAAAWWRLLDPQDLTGSWMRSVGPAVLRLLVAGQLMAATPAQRYVEAMVLADGLDSLYDAAASRVSATAFTGAAADGRALESLLYFPVIRTKTLLAGGMTVQEAMAVGQLHLRRIIVSEVADAGRGAAGVAMTANRTVTGYVRMVQRGACSRCVILAGRWYRWSADFLRHKRCHCYGVPATRARKGRHADPMGFFRSLTPAEQNRRFGTGSAQAIRDGADIYSVVNAARSTVTLDAYGRKVVATLEGTTRHGTFYQEMRREAEQRTGQQFYRRGDRPGSRPVFHLRTPRLTPSEIYRLAGTDRDEAIRLLRRFSYLY